MIRSILTTSILGISLLSCSASDDLLNFQNNDTLHGTFGGYTDEGQLIWKNDQAENPINFETKKLRRLVFNMGKMTERFTHNSTITLINGDVLPCELINLTKSDVTIRTDFTGNLTIPRKKVAAIDLLPLGNKALYQGPYVAENWKEISLYEAQSEKDDAWQLANFALLYNNSKASAVINESIKLPDAFQISFDLDLALYTSVSFAFHADFKHPEVEENNDDKEEKKPKRNSSAQNLVDAFGSSMILNITTSSLSLNIYSYDDDGSVVVTPVHDVSGQRVSRTSSLRDRSNIELRVNRKKKTISAYADRTLVAQWNLQEEGYLALGDGMGFSSYTSSNSKRVTAITNIAITPWLNIKDSAVSLENEEKDITLLTNGTDRFSGTIRNLEDNTISQKNDYADLNIPIGEIKSIHFATNSTDTWEAPEKKNIAFRFYGRGRLTGTPISGSPDSVKMSHPILGPISVNFKYLSSIDYTNETSILDEWLSN